MDANDTAVVKVVSGETEAEIVCGLLRTAGIDCSYRDTEAIDGPFEDLTASGPREILVLKSDLDAAQAVLADVAS
jgi:Putative prokaryotic signal transducing protein